jgi:hypothetical protein
MTDKDNKNSKKSSAKNIKLEENRMASGKKEGGQFGPDLSGKDHLPISGKAPTAPTVSAPKRIVKAPKITDISAVFKEIKDKQSGISEKENIQSAKTKKALSLEEEKIRTALIETSIESAKENIKNIGAGKFKMENIVASYYLHQDPEQPSDEFFGRAKYGAVLVAFTLKGFPEEISFESNHSAAVVQGVDLNGYLVAYVDTLAGNHVNTTYIGYPRIKSVEDLEKIVSNLEKIKNFNPPPAPLPKKEWQSRQAWQDHQKFEAKKAQLIKDNN